jgi:hypothetical protein
VPGDEVKTGADRHEPQMRMAGKATRGKDFLLR